jgi:hypothetical protein
MLIMFEIMFFLMPFLIIYIVHIDCTEVPKLCGASGEDASCLYEGHTYFERNMGKM